MRSTCVSDVVRAEHGSGGWFEVRIVHHAVAVDVVGPESRPGLVDVRAGRREHRARVRPVRDVERTVAARAERGEDARGEDVAARLGVVRQSRALSASQSVTFSARYLRMHWRNDATIAVRSAAETKAPASSASEEPATRRSEESTHRRVRSALSMDERSAGPGPAGETSEEDAQPIATTRGARAPPVCAADDRSQQRMISVPTRKTRTTTTFARPRQRHPLPTDPRQPSPGVTLARARRHAAGGDGRRRRAAASPLRRKMGRAVCRRLGIDADADKFAVSGYSARCR